MHVVYDPAERWPLALCGVRVVPDSYLLDPVRLSVCRPCARLVGTTTAALRPALDRWGQLYRAERVGALTRWWRTCWYSHRIRCAMAAEARR